MSIDKASRIPKSIWKKTYVYTPPEAHRQDQGPRDHRVHRGLDPGLADQQEAESGHQR